MNNPIISVIIPVYNTGKYLYNCIDSIINQTYKELDIILIDDGSTDGSAEVCDEYARIDSRITVIHQQNSGVSKARNAGIRNAKGDYFHFPDSDDYIDEDCYEYCLKLMNKHGCDIVSFDYYVTYSDHEDEKHFSGSVYGLFDVENSHRAVLQGIPFACNRIYSKNSISGLMFDETIFRGEDSLFVHQAIEQSEKCFFDKRAMYHYVQSEESAVRGKFRSVQLTGMKLYDVYKEFYEKKYPNLWKIFLSGTLHLPITLYYDMYADESDFSSEMKSVYNEYKTRYKEVRKNVDLPIKNKIKFAFFYISPNLFCKIHKSIHKL